MQLLIKSLLKDITKTKKGGKKSIESVSSAALDCPSIIKMTSVIPARSKKQRMKR